MAKLSKKTQAAVDQAIDHLGGGTPPIPLPRRARRAAKPARAAKAKSRKRVSPKKR
jgi:hypothetical protein